MRVIDASGLVLGRLASHVAKRLLEGEEIVIVNCEKIIISGKKESLIKEFLKKMKRGDPYHGPFYPRTPEGIVRRVVRGMLPKKAFGREAYKRLMVFTSVPERFTNTKIEKIKDAERNLKCKYIELKELCKIINGGKI